MFRTEVETVTTRPRSAVHGVAFYFDPTCPWTWITSQWLREVQATEGIDVQWRFFSLALANDLSADLTVPLRVLALVRNRDGNSAVGRVYESMGTVIHQDGADVRRPHALEAAVVTSLENAGYGAGLLDEALADEWTMREVEGDYQAATEQYGAYGSPWIVAEGEKIGFNGPVLRRPLRGDEASQMWEHVSWLIGHGDFFELKREHE